MGGVFISYRRDDSRGTAGRLYDNLSEQLGADRVFRDLDAIQPGAVYRDVIRSAIAACDALIVVIGTNWVNAHDSMGQRRLENPDDFVRTEISTALAHEKVVIPVLVEEATMPSASDLPADLSALADRNALPISDARWDYDVSRLVASLRSVGSPTPAPSSAGAGRGDAPAEPKVGLSPEMRRVGLPALAMLLLLLAVGVLVWRSAGGRDGGGPLPTSGRTSVTSVEVTKPDGPTSPTVEPAPPAPAGAIAISVGDTVGSGKPSGAGNIAAPGAKQNFTFAGTAGQIVYLRALPDSAPGVRWMLVDPSGATIKDASVQYDIGRVKLTADGVHTIRVYGYANATGVYRFTLLAVPPDMSFVVAVGATVGSNAPPGAGSIAVPGAVHVFTLAGTAGRTLYLKGRPDAAPRVRWMLLDPSGATIKDTSAQSDIGEVKLAADGEYTIKVYGYENGTGVYGFSVAAVP